MVFYVRAHLAIIDKEYAGNCKTCKAKLNCDSYETKVEVADKPLKDAMEQLKTDVPKMITGSFAAVEPNSAAQ